MGKGIVNVGVEFALFEAAIQKSMECELQGVAEKYIQKSIDQASVEIREKVYEYISKFVLNIAKEKSDYGRVNNIQVKIVLPDEK